MFFVVGKNMFLFAAKKATVGDEILPSYIGIMS